MYSAAQRELKAGRTRQCVTILREILDLDPKDSHSWLLLGRTVARGGETAKAREIFTKATAACPRSVHILQAWAVLESKYGRTDEARQLFARGLEVDPGNAYVCHAWGLMEQRLDNTDRARELFRAAFARAPQAKVCTALGELEACSGRVDLAREVFRSGIELCDEKSHIYMAWARVEEQVKHCY
jgi:Flp pilus assembly protein TadD